MRRNAPVIFHGSPSLFWVGLHKNVITALVSDSQLTEDNLLYPDQIRSCGFYREA